MSKKLFIYKSFGETLSFAESLGWKDNVEDDDWNTSVADSLEDEALTYIQEQGYRIIEEEELETMTKQEEIDMFKRDLDRFLEEQKRHNSECSKVNKLIMQEKNKEEEDIDPQPSLLDVKAYPTLNALFGRYDDDEKI